MLRTNIYLDASQAKALSRRAQELGVSRAELVRRFVDRGLAENEPGELEADLVAIEQSFGALALDDKIPRRGADERERHLQKMWRR